MPVRAVSAASRIPGPLFFVPRCRGPPPKIWIFPIISRFLEVNSEQNQFPKKKFYHHDTRCRGNPLSLPTEQVGEGGEHMRPSERCQQLLEALCLRRHDTYGNLAHEFNVSKMTIQRDITTLTCSYPIETVRGRYGGGVRVRDDYLPYRKILNKKQVKLLIKLSTQLVGGDLVMWRRGPGVSCCQS